ncbi:MAG TPA: hypothetical protein GXX19_10760 [Syntrophomonadaceae bacterium]|nr:hypothetical protein [Syntrophomonadaceae bacterium]
MKVTRKGITAALSVITALPLLAPAGRRGGLLPLLLYNSGDGGLLQIMERASGKTIAPIPGEAA